MINPQYFSLSDISTIITSTWTKINVALHWLMIRFFSLPHSSASLFVVGSHFRIFEMFSLMLFALEERFTFHNFNSVWFSTSKGLVLAFFGAERNIYFKQNRVKQNQMNDNFFVQVGKQIIRKNWLVIEVLVRNWMSWIARRYLVKNQMTTHSIAEYKNRLIKKSNKLHDRRGIQTSFNKK